MYRHTEKPILIETLIASGAVVTKRFIKPGGAQCDTEGEFAIGVSKDGAADGQAFPVATQGTALVGSGQALETGWPIATDANGRAILATDGMYILGIVARDQANVGHDVEVRLGNAPVTSTLSTTTTTSTTTSTTTTTTV